MKYSEQEFPVGMQTAKIQEKKELEQEVGELLEDIRAIPPNERFLRIAHEIREMKELNRVEFDDRMQVLRKTVQRGRFLLDLEQAKKLVESEELRKKYK